MLLTPEKPAYINVFAATPKAVEGFRSLSIDDKLRLSWVLHKHMGDSVASCSEAAGRIRLVGGLDCEVASLAHKEQLQVLRDLVRGVNTPATRDYGMLSSNAKLAFWRQLADEWTQSSEVIPVQKIMSFRLKPPLP